MEDYSKDWNDEEDGHWVSEQAAKAALERHKDEEIPEYGPKPELRLWSVDYGDHVGWHVCDEEGNWYITPEGLIYAS